MANGLNAAEEKMLRRTLRKLEALVPSSCLMGGGERRDLLDIAARIRLRLDPPAAVELDAEAQQLLTIGKGIDWFDAALAVA